MKRYLVLTKRNTSFASHGTAIHLEDGSFITSHAFDGLTGEYFISLSGGRDDLVRVVSVSEELVTANGLQNSSIAPFVYRLGLERQI